MKLTHTSFSPSELPGFQWALHMPVVSKDGVLGVVVVTPDEHSDGVVYAHGAGLRSIGLPGNCTELLGSGLDWRIDLNSPAASGPLLELLGAGLRSAGPSPSASRMRVCVGWDGDPPAWHTGPTLAWAAYRAALSHGRWTPRTHSPKDTS